MHNYIITCYACTAVCNITVFHILLQIVYYESIVYNRKGFQYAINITNVLHIVLVTTFKIYTLHI